LNVLDTWLQLDRLLDVLYCLLYLFLSWRVNNLLLYRLVFNSFSYSLLGNVFNILVLIDLRNVFRYIFYSVIISDFFFFRNIFSPLYGFVFNNGLLIWNIFNARFSFNTFMKSWRTNHLGSSNILSCCLHRLRLL